MSNCIFHCYPIFPQVHEPQALVLLFGAGVPLTPIPRLAIPFLLVAILTTPLAVVDDAALDAGAAAAAGESVGVVFNPGAYTHTSVALRDAIVGAQVPVVEVHITNIHTREAFRHHSYISPVARGTIVGLGVLGYELAIRSLVDA